MKVYKVDYVNDTDIPRKVVFFREATPIDTEIRYKVHYNVTHSSARRLTQVVNSLVLNRKGLVKVYVEGFIYRNF